MLNIPTDLQKVRDRAKALGFEPRAKSAPVEEEVEGSTMLR
jgi:hypothetical protein